MLLYLIFFLLQSLSNLKVLEFFNNSKLQIEHQNFKTNTEPDGCTIVYYLLGFQQLFQK